MLTLRMLRALAVCGLLASLLSGAFAPAAEAATCPADALALWSGRQLRGANIFQGRNPGGGPGGIGDGAFAPSDFADLAQAGANYLHISHAGLFGEQPPYALDLAAQANLDEVVQRAADAGLYAVIAFRSGPGRNENAITHRGGFLRETIWTDAAARSAWVAMLRYTAERYRSAPNVVGYGVMVEPNAYARHGYVDPQTFYPLYGGTLEDVNGLHALATAAIREVDADTPILLEPDGYGNVGWVPYLTLTGDARTVYTAHDYTPFDYAHELVPGASYPGDYDVDGDGQTEHVDTAFWPGFLAPLPAFATQHGVPVALTEFGAHRSAPNAASYLTDRIAAQDPIGSWAVWVWQPAGFLDAFSMHEPSAAQAALVAAWASNCTPAFGTVADADADGVPDATDDCPALPNPSQRDRGGVGAGSPPDGIGDACQCGDVSGDGRVTLTDAVTMMRARLVPPTASLAEPGLCDVSADAACTLVDAVVLRRSLLAPLSAAIQPGCAGAPEP